MGQAPSVVFEITVWVRRRFGSCTVRNETPASAGRVISSTHSDDTIRPANNAVQKEWISAGKLVDWNLHDVRARGHVGLLVEVVPDA
jgi:hypothetical protein